MIHLSRKEWKQLIIVVLAIVGNMFLIRVYGRWAVAIGILVGIGLIVIEARRSILVRWKQMMLVALVAVGFVFFLHEVWPLRPREPTPACPSDGNVRHLILPSGKVRHLVLPTMPESATTNRAEPHKPEYEHQPTTAKAP